MLVGGSGLEAFVASHMGYIEVRRKPRELSAKLFLKPMQFKPANNRALQDGIAFLGTGIED